MRGRIWLLVAVLAVLATGCPEPPSTDASTTTLPQTNLTVWALGDSQGANSSEPDRGLPWTERIGAGVGNGADNMYGGGWAIPSINTKQTITQRAAAVIGSSPVREFIVMAGINDLTGGRTLAQMLAGASEFADLAAAHGITVTWVGLVPFPETATISNRQADRNAFNAALAARYGNRFLDCSPRMSNASGFLTPGLSLSPLDLHLNNAGEQALADCINAFRS